MTPQEFALNALQSTPVSVPTAMSRASQRRRSSYSPAEESLRQLYGLPTYEQGVEEGQPSDQVIEQVSRPAIAPPPEYTPSNKERAVNLAVGAIGAIANPLDVPRGVVSNLLGQGSMMIAPEGYQLKNLGGLHSPVVSPFTQEGRVEGRELLRKWGIADRYRDTYLNFWGGIGLELATDPLTYINPFAGMTRAGVRLAGIGLGKKAIRESANNLALKAAKTKGKVLGKQMGGKASRFAMTPKTVIENLADETQQVVAKRDWLIAKGDLSHGDLISQLPEGTTNRGKTYEDLVWDEQVAIIDSRWKEITNKANDKYDALLDEPVGQWGDIGLPFMQPWKSIGSGQAPDKYMEKWVEKNLADPPRGAPSPGTGGPPPASGGTGPTQGPGGPSGGGPQGTPPTTGPVPSGPHTPPSGGAPGGQAAPTTPDPNSFLQRWARNENIPQQEIDDHVKSVAAAIASGRQGTDPLDVQFYRENNAAIEAELRRLAQSQITPPASGIPPVVTPTTPPPLGLDDYVSIPQRGAIRPVEGFIEDIVTGRKALIRDAQGNITTRTVPPSAVQTPPSQLPNTARQRGIEQIKLAAASVSGVTPEQAPRLASAVTSVMDALTDSIARRSGKSPEDVWGQLEWKVAPDDLTDRAKKSGGLPQDYAGKVYGQFTWDNGKGIIELDKIANATTFLHEPGHFVEKMLPHLGKNFEEIVKQHFSTKGVFDSEAFARAFEVYMHQGTMPANATAKLKEAFKSIRDLVVDIYRKIVSGDKATAALLASQANPKTQKIIQAIFDDATLKELQKAPKPTPTNKVIDDVTRSRKAPPAQPRPATAAAGVSNAELANVDVEIGHLEGIARDINKVSLNSTDFVPDEIARRANIIAAARELIARIETPGLKAELSTRLDAAESTINARFAELNAKQAKEFVKQPTPKPQTSTVDASSIIKESPQGVVVNRFLKSASLKADDPRFRVKLSSGVEGVGQRYGNLAVAKFADEADKPYSALAHIPTGMIITADGTITEQKQLAKLINAAELDMSFTDPKAATSETIAKLKALGYAWKHNDYSKLPEDVVELLARKTDMNQVKESDLVVDANYLSSTHSNTEYAKTSTPLIKSLAKEVPEFSYNPVMTVADDGSLVYKDHYEYRFSQTALLPKGVELSPGQTVAFNLQDFGVKTVSDEAGVVQNALRNAGFTVRKTADGLAASLGDQKVKVTGSGNQWKVSGQGGEVDALAERVVNGIAWNQPPQGGPQFQAQKPIPPLKDRNLNQIVNDHFYYKLDDLLSSGKVGGKVGKAQFFDTARNFGVKTEELNDLNIEELFADGKPKTAQEIMSWVDANRVTIHDVDLTNSGAMYGANSLLDGLPGTYREKLIKLGQRPPDTSTWRAKKIADGVWVVRDADGREIVDDYFAATSAEDAISQAAATSQGIPLYTSPHFGHLGENLLLHVRMDDVLLPDGKKALRVQEVQSDWHQSGKELGYKNDAIDKRIESLRESIKDDEEWLSNYWERRKTLFWKGLERQDYADFDEFNRSNADELQSKHERVQAVRIQMELIKNAGVSDAPIKKSWADLALKTVLKDAAAQGYDEVHIVAGEDIAKTVGGPVDSLSVFYDEILKSKMKSLTKKWQSFQGVRQPTKPPPVVLEWTPRNIDDPDGTTVIFSAKHDHRRLAIHTNGHLFKVVVTYDNTGGIDGRWWKTVDAAKAHAEALIERMGHHSKRVVQVYSVTPEMRADILSYGQPLYQAQKIPLSTFTEKAKAAAAAGRQKLKAGMDAIVGPDASMIIADAMDSVTARVTRNPGIAAIIGLFDRKVLDQLKPTVQVHAERLYDAMMEAERHANREAASVEHALIKSGFLDIKPLMDSGLTESQAVKVLQDRNRAVVNFFEFAFHQPDASIALTVDEIQAEIAKLTDQLKIIRKEERAALKAGDQARVDATAERAAQLENAIDVQQDNLTKRYREERVEANRLMAEAELERLGMGSIRSLLVDMIEIKDEAFNHALVAGYDPTALTDLYVEHWGRYAKKAGKQFLRDPNKGRPLDNIGEVMQRSFRNIAGGRATVNEMSIDPILSGIVHREPVGNDKIRPLVDSATGEILADAMPPLRDHIARTYGKDLIADFDPSTIGKPGGFDPANNTIFDSIIRELASLDAYHAEKQFPLFGHSFMEDFLMYIKNVHRAAYTTEVIQKIVADNIGSPELFAAIRAEAASELMQRYMKDIDNLVEYAEATQDIDRGRSISKAFRDIKLKSPIAWQRTLDAVQAKQPEYYAIYQKWLETALNAHAVKLAENGKTVVNSIGEGAVTFSIQEDTGRLLRTRIINVPWEGLGPIPKDYKGSRKVTEVAGPNDWDELIKQEAQFRFLDSYGINKDLEKLLTVWRKGWQDPEALHAPLLAYDGLLTLWKTSMTGLWPAFHSRNTISAVFNNWLFGAYDPTVSGHKKYLQPYVDMLHLLNGEVIPGIEKLPRFRGMTAEQATDLIRQEIFAHHVIGTKQGLSVEALNESFAAVEAIIPGATQTNAWPFLGKVKLVPKPSDATTADRLNPFASRGSLGWSKDQGWFTYRDNYGDWARWGQTAAQQTEKMVRGAAFIAYLKQGDSFASAAEKVARNHVDYSRLSGFERKVMRRIFPFYNWTRWMAPTIWQNLYENPGGKLANTLRIINRSRSDDPGTPDQILDTASIPLGESADGGQRYLTNFGFAFEEPVNLLGGILQLDPTQITQDIASRSLPLKFITEVASGRSMYFKGPGGYGQDLEQLDPPIGRTIQNIRDIVTGERTQDATPLGSVKFEHFLSQLPTSRAVNTVRTITDKRKWDNPTDLILNTLTGVRVRDVSANALDRNYQQRIMEDLKAHGAREFRRTYVPDTKLEALDTESRDAVDAMLDELKIIDRRFRSRREAEAEAKKVVQEGRILKQFITSGE